MIVVIQALLRGNYERQSVFFLRCLGYAVITYSVKVELHLRLITISRVVGDGKGQVVAVHAQYCGKRISVPGSGLYIAGYRAGSRYSVLGKGIGSHFRRCSYLILKGYYPLCLCRIVLIERSVHCCECYEHLILIRRIIRRIRIFSLSDLIQCIVHSDYILVRICSDYNSVVLDAFKYIVMFVVIQALLRGNYKGASIGLL